MSKNISELVATPYRFSGNKDLAEKFFEDGLYKTFRNIRTSSEKRFPTTIYYAFKQREEKGAQATGWETMLQGVISAGYKIVGTWPLRSEKPGRSISIGTNALASSIVLVCRPRKDEAPVCTRRELSRELAKELPDAVKKLQQAGIAPVDMAQSSIGPGMAVFSKYSQVLEADGTPMTVRAAIALINESLDQILSEQSGKMGPSTRFCADWFAQFGYGVGQYGLAEQMSKAYMTVVSSIENLDVLYSHGGEVYLIRPENMPEPKSNDFMGDKGFTAWWAVMQMAKALDTGGEEAVAKIMASLNTEVVESAKALCYRLYDICDRKKWSADGRIFNELITCWDGVGRKASEYVEAEQLSFFN